MDPDKIQHENIVGLLCDDDEKRVWISTYERMQRKNEFTDDSINAADLAVLEFRKRTSV